MLTEVNDLLTVNYLQHTGRKKPKILNEGIKPQ